MIIIKERRINRETGREKIAIHETTYFSVDMGDDDSDFYSVEYKHGGTGELIRLNKCIPTWGEKVNYFDYYDEKNNEGVILEIWGDGISF